DYDTEYGEGGSSEGGRSRGGVSEKVPDDFSGKATLAFRQGKDRDAMQYLYAHALTTEVGAETLLPTIRWVSGLKKPALAVRWGAGFVVTAPRNFAGDPKPIGTEQKIPTRGTRGVRGGDDADFGGGGGEDDYESGGGGDGGQESLMEKGAGELGQKLVASFVASVSRGDYGDVLKKAVAAQGGASRGGGSRGGSQGSDGYGDEESYEMEGIGQGGQDRGGPRGGGAAGATDITSLMPGLTLLGIGSQKELVSRARDEEVDVLVIIEMKLSSNVKTSLVTNETTIALYATKTPKSLFKTRKLNNITVQKARAEGKEDGVDRELDKLFEAIATNFKMSDLPAGLTAEVAARRVAGLATKAHDNPLPILAEAKMYHGKGMLAESQLFDAYEKILGVDYGRLLATGSEEDKIKVLNQWLPES
ncbi:MAG: hypothetical protein VCB43_02825, partial [Myxococcota bacterium]